MYACVRIQDMACHDFSAIRAINGDDRSAEKELSWLTVRDALSVTTFPRHRDYPRIWPNAIWPVISLRGY